MAEWVQARTDLDTDPVVIAQATALNMPALSVAFLWIKFWGWCREHTTTGRIERVTHDVVDAAIGVKGFSKSAGHWVEFDDTGLTIPKWNKHNDNGARKRISARNRKKRQRLRESRFGHASVTLSRPNGVTRVKSKEESKDKSISKQEVCWSEQESFTGVDDAQRKVWNDAYPSVNIDSELRKAHAWLVANPTKAGKRNYRKFLTNWLARGHDRGSALFASNKPVRQHVGDGSYGDGQAVLPDI